MFRKLKNKTAGLIQRSKRAGDILPRQITYKLFYVNKISSYKTLSGPEKKLLQDPWYHDFTILGVKTVQEPGIWKPNQLCKQKPLFSYIEQAISLCGGEAPKGVELFCADGFYANYAVQKGAGHVHGVDLDDKNLAKARLMTKLLGNSGKANFDKCDVFKLTETYDFGICAGGLYHISNPFDLLKLLAGKIKKTLVIQTVYSLAKDSKDYFETPAPGWTWGCRFSYAYLTQIVEDAGWKILSATTNELTGNKRPEDRGSAYLLCINKNKA